MARVAVECDGAEFHDEWRDEWRDAIVLGATAAEEVIRFAGQDLTHRPDDCCYALAQMHPRLFSSRAQGILARIASEPARAAEFAEDTERLSFIATAGNGDDDEVTEQHWVRVLRRRRLKRPQYWEGLYRVAVELGPMRLDDLIERDRASRTAKSDGW